MIQTRISRRFIRGVIVCLLIGAVVNVLVAWGCAMWSPYTRTQERRAHMPEHHGYAVSQQWVALGAWKTKNRPYEWYGDVAGWRMPSSAQQRFFHWAERRVGFPLPRIIHGCFSD